MFLWLVNELHINDNNIIALCVTIVSIAVVWINPNEIILMKPF